MRYLIFLVVALMATSAQSAQDARNANSFYGGVFGGLTIVPDIEATDETGVSADLETDAGFRVGGMLGYKFALGLRLEAEFSYGQNGNDNLDGVDVDGDISGMAFMGNVWYDIDTGTPWIPYLGGGVGVARVKSDIEVFGTQAVDDSDTVFAYQVGGGVGYEVSKGIVLFGDYRYLATTDPEFDVEPAAGGGKIEAEYSSHNIMVGIRGHF